MNFYFYQKRVKCLFSGDISSIHWKNSFDIYVSTFLLCNLLGIDSMKDEKEKGREKNRKRKNRIETNCVWDYSIIYI